MTITATPTKAPSGVGPRRNMVADMIAGLTTGVANIPDAMASAVLAGANPVQGLYALMVGTPLASIFGSSAFMNVSATSALAITAGAALAQYAGDPERHAVAIATLAVLTGAVMLLAGLLKAGKLLRFVANSVVIGFLTGVSINVILSQLGALHGLLEPLHQQGGQGHRYPAQPGPGTAANSGDRCVDHRRDPARGPHPAAQLLAADRHGGRFNCAHPP